jgi:hypothetical protein
VSKLRLLFIVNVKGAIRDDGERPAAVDEYTLSNVIDVCLNPGPVQSGLPLWHFPYGSLRCTTLLPLSCCLEVLRHVSGPFRRVLKRFPTGT